MRLSVPATVAALCASAQAFSDSSPFILFSTAKLSSANLEQQQQLQSSAHVLSSTKQILSSCPTDRYVLVSQPGLNAARHLRSPDAVPRLSTALDAAASRYTVAEVVGNDDDGLNLRHIAQYIRETCGVPASAVDEIELSPIDGAKTLRKNDDELGLVLGQYDAEGSYTVVYAGGPRTETPGTYTADFEDSVHTELKRQLQGVVRRADKSNTKLGLFDKYQFFTPGIFMGLIVLIVLMSMLYAGISAVASLEVPYGAFDKENGPAAQKKAQ
ncbi:BIG/ATPase V1 complex, subunit S1 [Biscogniauxia sp. FL1348]|nr:BIG/ATPase V1 complex, subunit S1 [Biscogniauxia sp. FL1348]